MKIIAALLILALAGCGDSTPEGTTPYPTDSTAWDSKALSGGQYSPRRGSLPIT